MDNIYNKILTKLFIRVVSIRIRFEKTMLFLNIFYERDFRSLRILKLLTYFTLNTIA